MGHRRLRRLLLLISSSGTLDQKLTRVLLFFLTRTWFTMIPSSKMLLKVRSCVKDPPIVALLAAEFLTNEIPISIEWSDESTSLRIDESTTFTSSVTIARYLIRLAPLLGLYGDTALDKAEVDHWITFSISRLSCAQNFASAITYLDNYLEKVTFLVGGKVSLADISVWSTLYASNQWNQLRTQATCPSSVNRWYDLVNGFKEVAALMAKIPPHVKISMEEAKNSSSNVKLGSPQKSSRKEEGKFVQLPGAEMDRVVVRFPPEASGYLHIGHAKAALLNQHYQIAFNGKLIMRFDDTNPAKETAEFEKVILEDVKLLDVKYDMFSHTSDHFEVIMTYCEKMIRDGKAYCDDTDAELMKQEREKKVESKNRKNGIDVNLIAWEEMKNGTSQGQKFCVRAKIDMQSPNGCMRDPTIYRCKNEPHLRTGNHYKVYPTYDFACPIVDSLEGVTHALRTTEYHDRDEQYYWFLERLGLRHVHIWEYSRLNMTNTVLSKRKLTWFVNEGLVDGWDDPRFPTVRGVLRRGMTVEGLKQFIIAQGSSKSVVTMEWDKIWSFNKKVIDPIASRYTALEKDGTVEVRVVGAKEETLQTPKHPKNESLGIKSVWTGQNILIDGADAETLKQGENVTFIGWGNLLINKIVRDKDGRAKSIEAEPNLENKDYKKTIKVTWLAETSQAPLIPCICVYFEHIIGKAVLDKDDDFKNYINRDTKTEIKMLAENELKDLKKSEIIQLQRRGFFICDSPYQPMSPHTGLESPLILFFVPDGHTKELPTLGLAKRKEVNPKEVLQNSRGKSAEKSPIMEQIPEKSALQLDEQIKLQGDKIRQLKNEKAAKESIAGEVKLLLALKVQYKEIVGKDWQPQQQSVDTSVASDKKDNADMLGDKIKLQGDKVRELKSKKVSKDAITVEVQALLALKKQYKETTGNDWQLPQETVQPSGKERKTSENQKEKLASGVKIPLEEGQKDALELKSKIDAQGDKVRQLKSSNGSADLVAKEISQLLQLKEQYKQMTGKDLTASAGKQPKNKKEKKAETTKTAAVPQEKSKKQEGKMVTKIENAAAGSNPNVKKITRLGLEATKEENLSDWYSQVITKAEMIEYYDVSGCYILRPWSFHIWEAIMQFFDVEIKKLDVQNCYFPMFVSQAALQKEKTHIADFAPEVAWVTKSGDTDLAEPIAIRPTSETVMYPSFAKWIKSHRDLPLKLNQWNSVVRWEFKHPQPFLRTREFLWQEGHTAFATQAEAEEEVYVILELYRRVYEELLAIPVIPGRKTEKEKFAGGDFTTTVEAYVSASGRGLQGATSHHLGQNFSKMFEIVFDDPETNNKVFAFQNSWGLSTRTIGAMVMIHSDNIGLVLPPRVAGVQVIVVPCGITASTTDEDSKILIGKCQEYETKLKNAGLKCKGDFRSNYSPGWKFNHWELKGVPIRLEVGPRDVKQGQFVVVRRDNGEKILLKENEAEKEVGKILEDIHNNLFNRAKQELDSHLAIAHDWNDFCNKLDKKCIIQAPFCGNPECEDQIKKDSAKDEASGSLLLGPSMGAKSLCIPFKQPKEIGADMHCINQDCKNLPKCYTLFGRSY